MREDEYSHKGIDRMTQIDRTVIDGNEFRRKFDKATDNPLVNRALYNAAKEVLYDRSGTLYESMYWIDGDTGKVITKFDSMGKIRRLTGEKHKLKVEYGEAVIKKVSKFENIVTIHNHPNSTAPSTEDINSAFIHNYRVGFTVSHNGSVYKYTVDELIDTLLYEQYFGAYLYQNPGAEIVNAQIEAFRKIAVNAKINVFEVLV
jgi:hypothetical protein